MAASALVEFTETHRNCHKVVLSAMLAGPTTITLPPVVTQVSHPFTPGCVHDYGEPIGTGGTRTCRKCGASFTYTE